MPFLRILAVSALFAASMAATHLAASAQTAVPITDITFIGQDGNFLAAQLIVPDRDTTKSAYGGKLRRYDVHIAKMFEMTRYQCLSRERTWSRIIWHYKADNGGIDMGAFDISCIMAESAGNAFGLGEPEVTAVTYYRAKTQVNVPILDITGLKVAGWMNYTKNLRPEARNKPASL